MAISIVQTVQNTATGTSNANVTVTIAATGAGNCLVVAVESVNQGTNSTVSTVTLGGVTDHFAFLFQAGTGTTGGVVTFWADPNCAGGQTSVAVTMTGGTSTAWTNVSVLEVAGLAFSSVLDQDHGFTNLTTSFTSGTTPTTTQANELWVGGEAGGAVTTITPAAPWVSLAQQNQASLSSVTSYQIVSATGTATYSGTFSASTNHAAAVVTLKPNLAVSGEPFGVPRGWILSGFDQNSDMMGSEGISAP